MPVKAVGAEVLLIDELENNDLNANEEDGATYNRLKAEMEKHGLLEFPVVHRTRQSDGSYRYRIIHGHHRTQAWRELGHTTITASVVEGELSREEEFNLVSNLNTIRGGLTLTSVKRVIRKHNLDVTKLDVFKFPVAKLIPSTGGAAATRDELQRRARVREMALRIAPKIAEALIDGLDDAIVAFHVEEKLVAAIRMDGCSARSVRQDLPALKVALYKLLRGRVGGRPPAGFDEEE